MGSRGDGSLTVAQPLRIAAVVGAAFDALGIEWLIGGSVASSLHGVPRATQDLDLVADLSFAHAEPLVERLTDDFYIDLDMVIEAIRRRSSFNVIHFATASKVDVFALKRDPISRNEMRRRVVHEVDFGEIVRLPVASPEDTILHKLNWYRQTGESSDRQWRDILGVIETVDEDLDRDYLRRQAAAWDLTALLEEAFLVR